MLSSRWRPRWEAGGEGGGGGSGPGVPEAQAPGTHLGVGVEGDDLLVLVQQLAGVGDVHGRLLLVAGENPDLQAGLAQFGDGFGNAVLQAVFDPSGTWSDRDRAHR